MHTWPRQGQSRVTSRMLGIGFVLISLILASCSAALSTDPKPQTPVLTLASQTLSPAPASAIPVPAQRLRVTNRSAYALHQFHIRFPDETVDFGDVAAGVSTGYQVFARGVYRYAAYDVVLDGQAYQQPVVDWIGESPMNGVAFTYVLDVDPSKWKTQGQVIQLVEVKVDQASELISQQAAVDAALKIAASSRPEISAALVPPQVIQAEQMSLGAAEQRLNMLATPPNGFGPDSPVWFVSLQGQWASEASAPGVTPSITQIPYRFYHIILDAQTGLEIVSSLAADPSTTFANQPPIATETIEPTLTQAPTPTAIPASWKTFSAPSLNIHFRYPAGWQAETPTRLSGTDGGENGFVEVSLRDYPASLFDVLRTVCVLEANPERPGVYGTAPLILDWQSFDPEQQAWAGHGCAVIPTDAPPSGEPAQAVLFARYPPPQMPDKLLVLRADSAHFAGILSTLRFQDLTTPTPSSGYYNSPACQQARAGQPEVVLGAGALVITETAIAPKDCSPRDQFDGFQALVKSSGLRDERSASYQAGLRCLAAENNRALERFGYRLVEQIGSSPIRFDLYQGESLLLGGLNRLGRVSVNTAGDDFVLWVQNNFGGNQPPVEVRNGKTRPLTIWNGGFNTAQVGSDLIGYEYADAAQYPVGAPARVNITRNGQVVDSLAVGQAGATGYPVEQFGSWNGHWLLEMDSILVQDGKIMNNVLGYAEIFHWNLLNEKPFFFYQKNARYGIHYDGQELALSYDDIIHGQLCCDPAVYSIVSTPSEVWFYALKDDIWYLVQAQTP